MATRIRPSPGTNHGKENIDILIKRKSNWPDSTNSTDYSDARDAKALTHYAGTFLSEVFEMDAFAVGLNSVESASFQRYC